jgi:long-chain fatty acid transport protein
MKKLLLVVLALTPVFAFAQGFQVNLEGVKQIGMGSTGTGTLQDGASVFFNPGAVAMLPQNYVQGGFTPLVFDSEFNPSGTNATYRTANKVAPPFTFYGVWGPKSSIWKLGLGVYNPFGGLTDWGDSWPGKYALESLDLKTFFIQPTLSVRLTSFMSIGAGFVYNHATIGLDQAIPLANSTGQDGQASLNGTGKGYGWNAGIYIKTESGATFGFTHRSGISTDFSGGALFSVAPSLQSNFASPNTFTSTVQLPATNSIGVGLYPSQKWTIAFDANLVSWSVFKTLAFSYNIASPETTVSSFPQDYKDALSLRGGAQYKCSNLIAIRFGAGYTTSAIPDGYVSPQVPDGNRVYFTGGLGVKLANHLDLDASFQYEHIMPHTQTTIQTQLSGTYETNVYIPGIALAYHW